MRHLFVMRHAKAKKGDGDVNDHQRPLRKRGRRQAAAMAKVLQQWQALEGQILVSDAARTRETLDEIAGQLQEPSLVERARFDEALYHFDGQALLAWLKALPNEADRVLVIGHNPALLELVHWLCGEVPQALPTGSLLHVTLPDTPWSALEQHSAELAARLNPDEASHALFKRKAPVKPSLRKVGLAKRIRGLLEHQYRMVRALEPGVMAGVDPEFLHQYRVNLRRSRAIGESVLATTKVPGLKKMLKRLKRRARATSELRDLDVFLESLTETPPPLSPRSHQALERWLQARHQEQHEALCQQLSTPDYDEEMQDWHGFIASKGFHKALRKLSSKRIEAVLDERIAGHDQDLASLSIDSTDEAFHELRKSVKRIRYLAELEPQRQKRFLEGLKHRQRLLGDLQDLCTRQAWIEVFSTSSRNAPRRKQECDAWREALEEQKRVFREQVISLAPLGT
ncbi:MAG: CHAD domain-containing protein [Pseudomonadota bacterium]